MEYPKRSVMKTVACTIRSAEAMLGRFSLGSCAEESNDGEVGGCRKERESEKRDVLILMQLTDCSSPASPAYYCSYSRQELPGCSGWLQWLEPSYASFAPYSVICFVFSTCADFPHSPQDVACAFNRSQSPSQLQATSNSTASSEIPHHCLIPYVLRNIKNSTSIRMSSSQIRARLQQHLNSLRSGSL